MWSIAPYRESGIIDYKARRKGRARAAEGVFWFVPPLAKSCRMKFPQAVAGFLALTLGSMLVAHLGCAFAQLPTPNPLIVPPPAPPPPAQLPPIAPQQGIPSLAIVPTPRVAATPTSALRVFNCSCFGSPGPTHWMGRVTAPGYFAARQAAVSTCLAYNENKQPQPPIVTAGPPSSAVSGAPGGAGAGNPLSVASGLIANQAAAASALSAGQQLPPTVTFFAPQQLRACSRCTCN